MKKLFIANGIIFSKNASRQLTYKNINSVESLDKRIKTIFPQREDPSKTGEKKANDENNELLDIFNQNIKNTAEQGNESNIDYFSNSSQDNKNPATWSSNNNGLVNYETHLIEIRDVALKCLENTQHLKNEIMQIKETLALMPFKNLNSEVLIKQQPDTILKRNEEMVAKRTASKLKMKAEIKQDSVGMKSPVFDDYDVKW